jgi:hypothetical protein
VPRLRHHGPPRRVPGQRPGGGHMGPEPAEVSCLVLRLSGQGRFHRRGRRGPLAQEPDRAWHGLPASPARQQADRRPSWPIGAPAESSQQQQVQGAVRASPVRRPRYASPLMEVTARSSPPSPDALTRDNGPPPLRAEQGEPRRTPSDSGRHAVIGQHFAHEPKVWTLG